MPKSIKIEETTYASLDHYRNKGETFSQAIDKLLKAASAIHIAHTTLYPPKQIYRDPQ